MERVGVGIVTRVLISREMLKLSLNLISFNLMLDKIYNSIYTNLNIVWIKEMSSKEILNHNIVLFLITNLKVL